MDENKKDLQPDEKITHQPGEKDLQFSYCYLAYFLYGSLCYYINSLREHLLMERFLCFAVH